MVETYEPGPVVKLLQLDAHLSVLHRREATKGSGLDLRKLKSLVKQVQDMARTARVKIDITADPVHRHPDFRYASVAVYRGGTMPIWTRTIK